MLDNDICLVDASCVMTELSVTDWVELSLHVFPVLVTVIFPVENGVNAIDSFEFLRDSERQDWLTSVEIQFT